MSWNEQTDNELLDLISEHGTKWKQLSELFSVNKSPSALKLRWQNYLCDNPRRRRPDYMQIQEPSNPILKAIQHRKHQFNRDGSQTSERLIPESALQTPETLMQAFDYNPDMFELVNSTANYWDSNAGEGNVITLYQAKVTVKPRKQAVDVEAMIKRLEDKREPYRLNVIKKQGFSDRHLIVPSFDTHFDGDTLPKYRESLDRTLSFIERNHFKESLLILGGDIISVDTVNQTTTRGTPQETVDIVKAFDEMEQYYETLIEAMLEQSNSVKVMQLNGNHDNTLGYAFARILKKAYSRNNRITFDVDLNQRKATMLGLNFIGGSHGDKGKKNYPMLFATEFAEMWAKATNREYYSGHLHYELTKDDGGILQRQMPTMKPSDTWHTENGFTMASKRFQLVTYTDTTTEGVHYV